MSEKSIERRTKWAQSLARCREYLFEMFSALAALLVAWRSVDSWHGQPVAPFTASVVVSVANGIWFWALLIVGIVQLYALVWGIVTNNGFRVRAVLKAIAAFIWTCVFGAALTAPGPVSVVMGYGLVGLFSWVEALSLMVRADIWHFGQKGINSIKEAAHAPGSRQRIL